MYLAQNTQVDVFSRLRGIHACFSKEEKESLIMEVSIFFHLLFCVCFFFVCFCLEGGVCCVSWNDFAGFSFRGSFSFVTKQLHCQLEAQEAGRVRRKGADDAWCKAFEETPNASLSVDATDRIQIRSFHRMRMNHQRMRKRDRPVHPLCGIGTFTLDHRFDGIKWVAEKPVSGTSDSACDQSGERGD